MEDVQYPGEVLQYLEMDSQSLTVVLPCLEEDSES